MTYFMRGRRGFDNFVRQATEAADLDFDQVADVHRTRVLRRARQYDVAGKQSDESRQVGEDIVNRENHFRYCALLNNLAVDISAQRGLANIHTADYSGTDRA